jgi:hypothetical protein
MRNAARATLLVMAVGVASAEAGGAWIPKPGHGYVYLGFSRKAAASSWDVEGQAFDNLTGNPARAAWHDFRYVYLSAEVGLFDNLSLVLNPNWLYGLEGPKDDYEKNVGLTDGWIGLKYQITRGGLPMAIGFNHRNDYFYDLEGPYDRHLFDEDGAFRGVSPEWRGLLKHDYSLSWLVSRSLAQYRGWSSLEAGYTWREGAPADQLFVNADLGYPLPFWGSHLKGALHLEHSRGNDSPSQPDDRFGSRATFNFNDASYAKLGGAFMVGFGANKEWAFEVGYNQWIWGHSARRYKEPYVAVGRSF